MQTNRKTNPEANPLINQIKLVFYNDLVNLILDQASIDETNIESKIKSQVKNTLLNLLRSQKPNQEGILLANGTKLTKNNCPTVYLGFYYALNTLKTGYLDLPDGERKLLEDSINDDSNLSQMNIRIRTLADNILNLDSFKEMLTQVESFILEAKNITPANTAQVNYDEAGVSLDLIRQTFYNEMVNQTIEAYNQGWITLDDLQAQEAFIYLALPALTLIEAINQSQNCPGIRLLNDKMLTTQNCPTQENFAELFVPILTNKAAMQARRPEEINLIKQLCLAKDMTIPQEALAYKTPSVVECAMVVNEIASQISRRGVFKEMVKKVIDVCLEDLQSLASQTQQPYSPGPY